MDTGAAYRLTLLALGALLAFAPAELLARGYGFDRQKQRAPERTGRFPASDWERPQRAVLDGFLHAYQPCVLETGDRDYPYRMWFFGWIVDPTNPEYPGCDAIYHARSRDLDHWEVLCRDGSWNAGQPEEWASILFASSDDERLYYNAWHVGDPSVVFRDGVYYMAFSSTSKPFDGPVEGYPSGMMLCVMGATSVDGVHWRKREFIPPDPGIAACQVPQAFVCRRNGHRWLYLFYATQIGRRDNGRTYEWLPAGEYNWFYDQIRYMRQRID